MDKDNLLSEICEIFNGISGKVLKAVFVEWKSGCKPEWTPEVIT
jgi:hypothetical protein